ncbi:YlxM family DNA-binding protein [Mesoplasma photuris]|uniref:YlxM family DNA-binding protein n=1 Tax=Mesoplasma photuris TaxID=217731 RepID=UPI0004E24300|nr:YlxM family DNA-binding protein [Mesoplasma photuris]
MTSQIEKTIELSMLFEIYKDLLTEKQREYFELYFEEDLSLQEISDELGVSRAAVHDSLNKTSNILINFEDKLKINQKNIMIKKIIENHAKSENTDVNKIIEKLQEVL